MNIAYVALAPFISGSERCLQLLLTDNIDHNAVLILHKGSPLQSWADERCIRCYTCDLSPLDTKRPWRWLWAQLYLLWIFIVNNIDVVHSNQIWSYPAICWPSSLLRIPRVCHFRDPINSGSRWWIPKRIHAAICVSEYIGKEFELTIKKTLYNECTPLIDPVAYREPKTEVAIKQGRDDGRSRLNVEHGLFVFGFVGQIAPVKGVLELLQGLAAMSTREWVLLIAGKDPSDDQHYIRSCYKFVEDNGLGGNVRFLGFLDDVDLFYAAVDVVVMFSKEEPLGLIPLEAGMCYTPAIVSSVGGLPETVNPGASGWVVSLQLSDLSTILFASMSANINEMGIEARRWAERKTDLTAYRESLSKIYEQLIY